MVENWRRRNIPSGTSGCGRRAISRGNATSATAPTISATQATGSCQLRSWPRIAPKARPPTATIATPAPSQSNRADASPALLSATWRNATSARITSGTLIRKAARHVTMSTSSPPTTGPISPVAAAAAAHSPMARDRCTWSANVAVMIASEPGTSSAPAAPWSRRATTSSSSVGARPHSTEVIPKPVSPIANSRRRP